MKVIVSGGTGYIGGQVLDHCLKHPSITVVLVLSRRELPKLAENPKAKVIVLKDFTVYDEATTAEVNTANAAIWCLGTYKGDMKVDIDFLTAFITAMKSRAAGTTPFRFVHLGGAFTEPPVEEGQKERSLWYFQNGRRVRGLAEAKSLEATDNDPRFTFKVHVVKPAAVVPKDKSVLIKILPGKSMGVKIDELAATMVDLALNGSEQTILSNKDIISHGRQLLEQAN